MSKRVFSILIPTWNNPQFLDPCMASIRNTGVLHQESFGEVIIINNGKQPCKEQYKLWENVRVLDAPENLGWEGGLKLGLENSDTKFVCFQNDDTFIPPSDKNIYENLLLPFQDKYIAAVGPGTTVAAGVQSIYHPLHPFRIMDVRWLIFFTVMIKREYLDRVGGVDNTLPGGDDFDLSIRFNQAGYRTILNPDAFLIHHGFKTGERVFGNFAVDGGWNSQTMSDRTNHALIVKHGFKTFFETMNGQIKDLMPAIEDLNPIPHAITIESTLDRLYEGDVTTIPLESVVK